MQNPVSFVLKYLLFGTKKMSTTVHILYNQNLSLGNYFRTFIMTNTTVSVLFLSHCIVQPRNLHQATLFTHNLLFYLPCTTRYWWNLGKCLKYYLVFTSSLQLFLCFSESLGNFWLQYLLNELHQHFCAYCNSRTSHKFYFLRYDWLLLPKKPILNTSTCQKALHFSY